MLHQIGSGALGPVFRGFDPLLDRVVVIKALQLDLLPEQAIRLADRLATLTRALPAHPNLVPILDAGIESSTVYLVLGCVTGDTLDVVMRRATPPDLVASARLIDGIAAAIDAAAAAGVPHGALHPRDVLIDSVTGAPRLTGFGVARALASVDVNAPVRRPYTAPERASGPWDSRTDVYSLGAIAHEILTGRRPIAGADDVPEFTVDCTAAERVGLRRALTTALSERPADRWPTGRAFAAAVLSTVRAVADPVMAAVSNAVPDGRGPELAPVDAARVDEILLVPVAAAGLESFAPEVDDADDTDAAATAASEDVAAAATAAATATPTLADDPIDAFRLPTPGDLFESSAAGPARSGRGWAAAGVMAAGLIAIVVVTRPFDWIGAGVASPVPAVADAPADTEIVVPTPAPIPPAVPAVNPRSTPAAATGELVVRSEPSGALVTINGRLAGDTPATVGGLRLGSHTIQVARPGFVPRQEVVTLTERAPTRAVLLALRPGLQAGEPAIGAVFVDSRPRGARVLIDGRLVGTTPLRVPGLAAGAHSVRIELGGYRTIATPVTVTGGDESRLAVTLERRVATAAPTPSSSSSSARRR